MALKLNKSSWRLLRYARFIRSNDVAKSAEKDQQDSLRPAGTWKHYSWSDSEQLLLTIQDASHLLITRGKLILESHPLFDSQYYIKAAVRGDCVLFMQRIKNECRRFRVKLLQASFSSTLEACEDCVTNLKLYFQVRYEDTTTSQNPSEGITMLQGEVSLGSVAKIVTGSKTLDLPSAYHSNESSWTPDQLTQAVTLCLSDPTFPAFVESVEKQFKRIISE